MTILNAGIQQIKKGDKLKCVDEDTCSWWTKNQEYEVQSIDGELCIFDGDNCRRRLRNIQTIGLEFELVKNDKVVVPQFVANWFEEHKYDLEYNIWDLCVDSFNSTKGGMYSWVNVGENKPIETLIKMKLYGYEVEQEKLYYVKLVNHEKGYLNKNITGNSLAIPTTMSHKHQTNKFKTQFTEEEIKAINPLFWNEAFLEEVEY